MLCQFSTCICPYSPIGIAQGLYYSATPKIRLTLFNCSQSSIKFLPPTTHLKAPPNQGRSRGGARGNLAPLDISKKKTMPKRLHNFIFFATTILTILGRVIHHWKGVFKTFPTVYYKPPNSKTLNW